MNNIKDCQWNKILRNQIHAWSREQYLSHRGLNIRVSDCATQISFYSCHGIVMDNINGNEISVIDTWLETNMARKYTWLKDLSQVLWKGNISCLWVHVGASLDVGDKSNILMTVTFQNVVQNSCNAPAGGPTLRFRIGHIDQRLGLLCTP
jgi:hypothetical protein